MAQNVDPDDLLGKAYDARIVRRLLAYVVPYRGRALAAVAATLLAIGADLMLPVLFRYAVDEVRPGGNRDAMTLNLLGGAFVVALLARFAGQWAQLYLVSWLGNRVVYDLRDTMFRHLQRLSIGYIDRRGVGAIMTRIQNDVSVLNELFSGGVPGMIASSLILVGIVVVMLITDWQLALLALAVLPIMGLVMARWRRRAVETYRATRRTIGIVNADLAESIAGVRVVQAFGQEPTKRARFHKLNMANRAATIDAAELGALLLPVVILLGSAATVLVLYVGGRLAFGTRLTPGELVLFITLVDRFFEPIRDLSQQYNQLQAGMAAGERVFEVLDV